MHNEGEVMQTEERRMPIYEICEECHGNGFTKPRLADKDINTTYVCNSCGGSGHSGKYYK